jgi:hypothetical protein
MLYREFAEKVFHRRGNMLPANEVAKKQGFCSIYAFQEDAAKEIIAQGNSKGLGRFPVWSDKVVFDLDNGEEGLADLLNWAKERGLGYRLYFSGSKGYHCEIPHIPVLDKNLPYTHRLFAEATGISCDPSMYQHARLYRLEGTLHEKTGKPKQFVEEVEGENLLEIAIREPPESRFKIRDVEDSELLPFFLSRVATLAGSSPGPGRRHISFWQLAKDAYQCGISFDTTLELCLTVNGTWKDDAKEYEYVLAAVTQGYDG